MSPKPHSPDFHLLSAFPDFPPLGYRVFTNMKGDEDTDIFRLERQSR